MKNQTKHTLLSLTVQIAAAHVSYNQVPLSKVSCLIKQIHRALVGLGAVAPVSDGLAVRPQPAVPIKKSVTNEYIICLEDGQRLKMLKRYLGTAYNMTPEQYRDRWNLPADYPMTAPAYSKHRAFLAKKIGLGNHPGNGRSRQVSAR